MAARTARAKNYGFDGYGAAALTGHWCWYSVRLHASTLLRTSTLVIIAGLLSLTLILVGVLVPSVASCGLFVRLLSAGRCY